MHLVANMLVRNADWVLGLSARVALRWCDGLVMLLHACDDRSADIAAEVEAEHPGKVRILTEPEPLWDEMRFRQRMLEASREMGASHIAIVDTDEVLTGNVLGGIRDMIARVPVGRVAQVPLYNLRGGIGQYHANGIWGNRWVTMAFADAPNLGWHGDTWHHREPMGSAYGRMVLGQGRSGVMHLWGASERRLKAHHAHYKLNERLRWPAKPVGRIDDTYSWAIHGPRGEAQYWTYADVPESWWRAYRDLMPHLKVDAEPWEEAECRRIVTERPGIERGLDLFGVC